MCACVGFVAPDLFPGGNAERRGDIRSSGSVGPELDGFAGLAPYVRFPPQLWKVVPGQYRHRVGRFVSVSLTSGNCKMTMLMAGSLFMRCGNHHSTTSLPFYLNPPPLGQILLGENKNRVCRHLLVPAGPN